MNPAIRTFTDKLFTFAPVDPDLICIEDIAHSLSMKVRFGGHTREFYSVAEHSVHASYLGDPRPLPALKKLMHDADESYGVDLPTPLKHGTRLGLEFRLFMAPVQDAIQVKFGLEPGNPTDDPDVRRADLVMRLREHNYLFPKHPWIEAGGIHIVEMEEVKLYCWSPPEAELYFLQRFHELQHQIGSGGG